MQTPRAEAPARPVRHAGSSAVAVVAALEALLRSTRAPDGGWPYYADAAPRIEPTCWAHITTSPHLPITTSPIATFLRRGLRPDGLVADVPSAPPNYAWNGLALLSLRLEPGPAAADLGTSIERAILAGKGIQLEPDLAVVKQDSRLQAWPWTGGTFSWVEPTAWCVLALKKARGAAVDARLAEAEALLADRACVGGGWNYGNSQVLLQDLRPYVPTTALALLALQDRRSLPVVAQGLDWLEAHATSESSAFALSWAAICLCIYGRAVTRVLDLLAQRHAATSFLGNVHSSAMALFALTMDRHDARAFRLP